MSRVTRTLAVLGLFASPMALSQQMFDPTPPLGPMWEMQADGDALQKDLGFIVPAKWKNFTRDGFSSGRADGGSVKAYYTSDDETLKLTLWIQLRIDMRGMPMPAGSDWSLLALGLTPAITFKTKEKPTELSSGEFAIGKRTPLGRQRWVRYAGENGPEVQGGFWQNIGVWAVLVTVSGPEARREELEKHAQTLFAEMPFPSAPLATELAAIGEGLLAAMPKCRGKRPEGAGKEFVPTFHQAALMALMLPGMMVGQENQFIVSPVTQAKDYCVIETFNVRKDFPVTAIEYRGKPSEAWEPRYGFLLNGGRGGYYQLERMPAAVAQATTVNGVTLDQVFLNFSNNKRASISAVFDDWPSYEVVKKTLAEYHKGGQKIDPIITSIQTAERREISTNQARIQKLEE